MAKFKIDHSFPAFDAFRAAVDLALASIADRPVPAEILCYPTAYETLRTALSQTSSDADSAEIAVTDIAEILGEMTSEAVFASVLHCFELEPYFSIAQTLRDALSSVERVPALMRDDPRWIEAIRIAFAYRLSTKNGHLAEAFQAREYTLAMAVRFFNAKQIALSMRGRHINIPSNGVKLAVAETVLAPLRTLGDTRAMKYLDDLLDVRYDHRVSRLHFHASPDIMGRKIERQLPCGLLYRYALKTLGEKPSIGSRKPRTGDVERAGTHFAALHDVEPFSIYETILPPRPGKLMDVLTGVALFDELFAVPQCAPVVISNLLTTLQQNVPSLLATEALHWSVADAKEFWLLLLECSGHMARSHFIGQDDLKFRLIGRVGPRTADALLRSFVIKNPNTNYFFPVDASQADTRECAIAEASGRRFWVPGQLMLGPAFFARLVGTRAAVDRQFSDDVGPAFEAYLVKRLTDLGFTCRRGNVRGQTKSKRAGDVDLILETPAAIALFELKKKGLKRVANTGNGLGLISDLAQGLVQGLNQISKHEITLLCEGRLSFEDGTTLLLGGRRVIKGVITLADFGGLHDASTVRNLLEVLAGATLTKNRALANAQSELLAKTNRELETLGKRYMEFREAIRIAHPELMQQSSNDREITLADNVVFCNVFLIEYLLTRAKTAEELIKALSTGTRISSGIRDQFFEHAQMIPLPKQ